MSEAATICERCGEQIPAHRMLETDCVLDHADHADRFVGVLCKRHYHWIDNTLTQIEELFALLPEVAEQGPGGDGRSATRVGSPAPGRVEVMALTDRRAQFWREDEDAIPDVLQALDSWCRMIEEESGIALRDERELRHGPHCRLRPDPAHRLSLGQRLACKHSSCRAALPLPAVTLSELTRYLHRWRHWVAQQAWIDDYAKDLADLHLALARGVGDSMWPKSIGKCPNCGSKLFNTRGVDEVGCRRCKSQWQGLALVRLRLILEQEAG